MIPRHRAQEQLVADLLAVFAIAIGTWSAWIVWLFRDRNELIWRPDEIWRAIQEIALSVPNHAVTAMCFHNRKWMKHAYCDGCKRWLEPTQEFGPYRYSEDILRRLQAMENFRGDALPEARAKAWKWCSLTLAACPSCRQFFVLRVVKWERHPFGVASHVLGFLTVDAVQGSAGAYTPEWHA